MGYPLPKPGLLDSGRGTTRAEDAAGTPDQNISPSILVSEGKDAPRSMFVSMSGRQTRYCVRSDCERLSIIRSKNRPLLERNEMFLAPN